MYVIPGKHKKVESVFYICFPDQNSDKSIYFKQKI